MTSDVEWNWCGNKTAQKRKVCLHQGPSRAPCGKCTPWSSGDWSHTWRHSVESHPPACLAGPHFYKWEREYHGRLLSSNEGLWAMPNELWKPVGDDLGRRSIFTSIQPITRCMMGRPLVLLLQPCLLTALTASQDSAEKSNILSGLLRASTHPQCWTGRFTALTWRMWKGFSTKGQPAGTP